MTFTDAHTGSHRRLFDFGDGVTRSTKSSSVTHTYTTAGTYIASLETIDLATGLRVTLLLTITVNS